MSDESGGPGWWLASDGTWCPPESKPGSSPSPPPSAVVAASPVVTSGTKLLPEQWATIGSVLVVIFGALLPWATIDTGFGGAARSGIAGGGDGFFTLALAAVAAVAAWRLARAGVWIAAVCGALITAVGMLNGRDITEHDLEVGVGLLLTMLGGVVMFAAALATWSNRRKRAAASRRQSPAAIS